MENISKNIQDNTQQQDTAKVVQAAKILVPATKIESSEGAIVPKEAIAMIPLQPSIPVKKENDSMLSTYLLIGALIIGVFILVKLFSKKNQKRSV